ncbi:hypothetical protein VPAL9027_00581 [Vibrio palustris]|uniref:Uncharacterized protein n=1 Tax=Vibrio palustris TaxID=1918946 RepID=A0A1R4B156_9VIBR|nr:hypothetical protein VPAL9027_00581 [Vibrio palustris]
MLKRKQSKLFKKQATAANRRRRMQTNNKRKIFERHNSYVLMSC